MAIAVNIDHRIIRLDCEYQRSYFGKTWHPRYKTAYEPYVDRHKLDNSM